MCKRSPKSDAAGIDGQDPPCVSRDGVAPRGFWLIQPMAGCGGVREGTPMRASVGVFWLSFVLVLHSWFIVAGVFPAKKDLGRPPVYCQIRHPVQS